MAARRFLVDGYNLLYAVGLPARLGAGQLHHARGRLLSSIAARFPHDHVTVVFDAHQAPRGAPRRHVVAGVDVVFAHGEADDLIQEMLNVDANPRSLHVVSSDHAVQRSARRREAKVIEAIEFLDDLNRPAPPPSAERPEKPTSPADNQLWLDAFKSIDDEPDVRRMQQIDLLNPDAGKTKRHRSNRKEADE